MILYLQEHAHPIMEQTSDDVPMPTYFCFLALLAFKIDICRRAGRCCHSGSRRFDATNVVEHPIVCGIASLGYDHMEILEIWLCSHTCMMLHEQATLLDKLLVKRLVSSRVVFQHSPFLNLKKP